jgi:hypothetical protein
LGVAVVILAFTNPTALVSVFRIHTPSNAAKLTQAAIAFWIL